MKISKLIIGFIAGGFVSTFSMAVLADSMTEPNEMYMSNAQCGKYMAVFESNTRTTAGQMLYILDGNNAQAKKFKLNKETCYGFMTCVDYKGKKAIALVDSPACLGNGVTPDFILIDTATLSKKVLSTQQARKEGVEKQIFH